MNLLELYKMGGWQFMGMLTILALVIIGFCAKKVIDLFLTTKKSPPKLKWGLNYIRSLGLLALVVGVFGQVLGLFEAFQAIEEIKEVPPSLLAGGLKVSSITTIYGFIIYIFSYLGWFLLNLRYERLTFDD